MRRSAVVGAILLPAPLLAASPAAAQDTLRLGALQEAAVREDPRMRRLELEEAATELRLRDLAAERLPELTLTGEATVQSEVAAIPVAGPDLRIPTPPKERYEAALGADWLAYDGGVVAARSEVERAELEAARAEVAAELYPLRVEVLETFFDALLLQERIREVSALVDDLEARLSETRDLVRAGAALPGDTAALRAEILRALQRRDEAASDRRAALAVLGELTGRAVSADDVLALPDLADAVAEALPDAAGPAAAAPPSGGRLPPKGEGAALPRAHPRYAVFDARRERLEREAAVIRARRRPRLAAFGEYAYGRPGLKQFTRDLHDYWIAGLRVRWIPWDRGTPEREVATLRIRERVVDTEEAAFTAALRRQVQRPFRTMRRLEEALETDLRIVALREQVERQARAQLAERAITPATYVDARTDLQEARLAYLRHRAELARARARYLTTLGVELP